MKKFLAILLAAVMVIGMSATGFAALSGTSTIDAISAAVTATVPYGTATYTHNLLSPVWQDAAGAGTDTVSWGGSAPVLNNTTWEVEITRGTGAATQTITQAYAGATIVRGAAPSITFDLSAFQPGDIVAFTPTNLDFASQAIVDAAPGTIYVDTAAFSSTVTLTLGTAPTPPAATASASSNTQPSAVVNGNLTSSITTANIVGLPAGVTANSFDNFVNANFVSGSLVIAGRSVGLSASDVTLSSTSNTTANIAVNIPTALKAAAGETITGTIIYDVPVSVTPNAIIIARWTITVNTALTGVPTQNDIVNANEFKGFNRIAAGESLGANWRVKGFNLNGQNVVNGDDDQSRNGQDQVSGNQSNAYDVLNLGKGYAIEEPWVRFDLRTEMFTSLGDNGAPNYNGNEEFLSRAAVEAMRMELRVQVSKGNDAIASGSPKFGYESDGRAYAEVAFIKEHVSVDSLSFDFKLYLVIDGHRENHDGKDIQVWGNIDNYQIDVFGDARYFDAQYKDVLVAREFNPNIRLYAGEGVYVQTKLFKGQKYYLDAVRLGNWSPTQADEAYADIDNVLEIRSVNVASTADYVTLSGCRRR